MYLIFYAHSFHAAPRMPPNANRLHVNDKQYHVQPPKRAKLSIEDSAQIGDIRVLVSQVKKRHIIRVVFFCVCVVSSPLRFYLLFVAEQSINGTLCVVYAALKKNKLAQMIVNRCVTLPVNDECIFFI